MTQLTSKGTKIFCNKNFNEQHGQALCDTTKSFSCQEVTDCFQSSLIMLQVTMQNIICKPFSCAQSVPSHMCSKRETFNLTLIWCAGIFYPSEQLQFTMWIGSDWLPLAFPQCNKMLSSIEQALDVTDPHTFSCHAFNITRQFVMNRWSEMTRLKIP